MWASLSVPWQAAFEQAWEAYCNGSIPIGAVLADREGGVLYRGRNRVHEAAAPSGQVCQNRLAHAEVNVLLQAKTPRSSDMKDCTLYTTTEPCVLCFGAIVMSGVRAVRYAASDPVAGGTGLNRSGNAFIRERNIDVRKADHHLGEIQRVLRTDYVLRTMDAGAADRFLTLDRMEYPEAVELGREWHAAGRLQDAVNRSIPIAEIVDEIGAALGKG